MSTSAPTRPTFGGWISMKSTFAFGLTKFTAAIIGVEAIVFFVFLFAISPVLAIGVLVIEMFITAPLVVSFNERTAYEEIASVMQWRKQKRTGQNILRGGPLSRQPGGRCRLPGVLAPTEMWWSKDKLGNNFGMIRMKSTGQYTVVLRCSPQGDRNIEQDTINEWVGSWGYFLAALGQTSDIDGCVVVIDSRPDTGATIRAEIDMLCAEGLPPQAQQAQQVLREHVRPQGTGAPRVWAHMAITFRAMTTERRREPLKQALEIGNRLPSLYEHMSLCGVVCEPMLDYEIAGTARIMYDPESQEEIEEAIHTREDGYRPEDVDVDALRWEDAGPIAVDETKKTYHHDSGVSQTLVMRVPPAGTVTERVLKSLLRPRGDVPRKRVAIVYRPHSAADAAAIIDRDFKSALAKANQSRGPMSPTARIAVAATTKAREEEAHGHGLSRFAIIVTVTALEERDLEPMVSTVKQLFAQSRMKPRIAYRNQAAAFAAGTGLGVLMPDHATAPKALGG